MKCVKQILVFLITAVVFSKSLPAQNTIVVSQNGNHDFKTIRRIGYAWYGDWPADFLEKEYFAWQSKWNTKN
ncbi:MAG: hypothetical protein ABIN67_11790 [Ferruginibacter sp.]